MQTGVIACEHVAELASPELARNFRSGLMLPKPAEEG
jgi:hypothetical protein